MAKFEVFVRNWWKLNPSWPNGLEPDAGARKTHIAYANDEEEAQAICKEYMNKHRNLPGKLSRKAEYTSQF